MKIVILYMYIVIVLHRSVIV